MGGCVAITQVVILLTAAFFGRFACTSATKNFVHSSARMLFRFPCLAPIAGCWVAIEAMA
jgi:hypothetical protein